MVDAKEMKGKYRGVTCNLKTD